MFKSTQFLTVTLKIDMCLKKTIILATKFLPTNVSKPRGHISVGNVFFFFFNYIYLKRFP